MLKNNNKFLFPPSRLPSPSTYQNLISFLRHKCMNILTSFFNDPFCLFLHAVGREKGVGRRRGESERQRVEGTAIKGSLFLSLSFTPLPLYPFTPLPLSPFPPFPLTSLAPLFSSPLFVVLSLSPSFAIFPLCLPCYLFYLI